MVRVISVFIEAIVKYAIKLLGTLDVTTMQNTRFFLNVLKMLLLP